MESSTTKPKESPSTYDNYRQWKNWSKDRSVEKWFIEYFEGEIRQAGLTEAKSLLEVGFGNGDFMRWALSQGKQITGTEIIPELVERGRESGLDVYLYNIADMEIDDGPLAGKRYDGIILFDVIEHLTAKDGMLALKRLAGLLNPGGRIVLRFPNGDSPLSVPIQNGDHTHRNAIAKSKLVQMCLGTGLTVLSYRNAQRIAARKSTAWFKWILFRLRDLTEIVVGYLFFNQRRPLDPVATAVLGKAD
ncbi:class I SAM-dependent methyltransferase [Puniceicoccales bacterium CK1056]|uniref:Class I SAM-dependent methyltransferase n=1 Tax=Oceanipulchritudo coccoides TaxID=2706888 RepID=A0A6B2M5F2_9BACT|nr:class I SAM-dependent methyltransferase [Oceanipulchritudo coccoides]NDV63035.1 class I SAM-dependent methyltransferase [Oceanipulchritudo coccoides]